MFLDFFNSHNAIQPHNKPRKTIYPAPSSTKTNHFATTKKQNGNFRQLCHSISMIKISTTKAQFGIIDWRQPAIGLRGFNPSNDSTEWACEAQVGKISSQRTELFSIWESKKNGKIDVKNSQKKTQTLFLLSSDLCLTIPGNYLLDDRWLAGSNFNWTLFK